jgi:hypothetical protein
MAKLDGSRNGHDCWWRAPKRGVHSAVDGMVSYLRHQSNVAREDAHHHMRLYSNFNVNGEGFLSTGGPQLLRYGRDGRPRFNLVASVVDTAASKIAQNKPTPFYCTTGGDYGLMRKAQKRSRVVESQMNELGAFELAQQCFFDGAINGLGAVYGYVDPDSGLPKLERVLPLELLVDQADGIAGKPRSMYRVRPVAREVLQALYPSAYEKLRDSKSPGEQSIADFFLTRDNRADQVLLYEAWHLPSSSKSKDGRHVLCVDNVTLVDEDWTRQRFPFAFFRYKHRQFGFAGMPLVESCRAGQQRINDLIRFVSRCQDLLSNAIVQIEENTGIQPDDLANIPALILRRNAGSNAAVITTTSGTPVDLQQEIDRITQQVLFENGLSEQDVQGQGPDNAESAVAKRAADDISSRRLLPQIRNFERFCLDIAVLIEDVNDECAEADAAYSPAGYVRQGRKTFLQTSRWADLALPEGDARIDLFPMSALPTTPQGKWSAVTDWIQGGFISKPFAMQLLQFPDLDAYADTELAHLDIVQWQIEQMLDATLESEPVLPVSYQDMSMAVDLVTKAFLKAYTMSAHPHVLDMMTDYIDYAKQQLESAKKAAQQNAPQQMQAPAGPVQQPQESPAAAQMAA